MKASLALASLLLLLVLLVWVPVSAVDAHEEELRHAPTGIVQATPTEDATVTALNKEKLAQEVQQLKNQNAPDLFAWLRTNAAILLSTLVVVIGGLIGFFRWLGDRRDEQKKRREDQRSERERRTEERFQAVVEGLGSTNLATQVGAAIMLRTFLQPGYEQFYSQAFDLVVAHLRLREADPNTPEPLNSLSQALITVFKESFPLVRGQEIKNPQLLDATSIQLDNAYLRETDLKQVWMPRASLRKANLIQADLSNARLVEAHLSEAHLGGTILSKADLSRAILFGARLNGANLSGATLSGANFSMATLHQANLSGANLNKTDLTNAELIGIDLSGADLSTAKLHGAKYNIKPIKKDIKGIPTFFPQKSLQANSLILEPTIWPQGFDPVSAGLNCVESI